LPGHRRFFFNQKNDFDKLNQPIEQIDGAHAFRAELIPKDLNALFEGVHFNGDTKVVANTTELRFFATVADYVWNPDNWNAVESSKRARHFVRVMQPLIEIEPPPNQE
jgi:hypothetical protein